MSNLLRIRACVQQYVSKQEADRTAEFLYAAAQGNVAKLREMVQQGCPVNSADYDGRCALELACAKGHPDCAKLLLAAGADPSQRDALGSCPLAEACAAGQDDLVELLLAAGARLAGDPVADAARLCGCVFSGDLPLLRRLLRCGLAADAGDYDRRTALHVAAAEGNLAAVRLLVEEGGADPGVRDRWGHSPLDEARRVGAGPVVRFLLGGAAAS
jgi:ankyrin repeat protein